MLRLLLIFLVTYFLIKLLKRTLINHLESKVQRQFGRGGVRPAAPASGRDVSAENQTNTEILTACPKCGTFFQKEKGVSRKGQWFCGEECAHFTSHTSPDSKNF